VGTKYHTQSKKPQYKPLSRAKNTTKKSAINLEISQTLNNLHAQDRISNDETENGHEMKTEPVETQREIK